MMLLNLIRYMHISINNILPPTEANEQKKAFTTSMAVICMRLPIITIMMTKRMRMVVVVSMCESIRV